MRRDRRHELVGTVRESTSSNGRVEVEHCHGVRVGRQFAFFFVISVNVSVVAGRCPAMN